ncbi:uncharacterized protein LOC110695032 [Chenopodium quinoa]|uniref:uncharacterized protein LOC110695032 n=1 Tax=Chenopodium quinoa TaxID=63459 RepID=UPI000B7972C3|nr:uncharacterized protein LOC110695032 [Chenopodium quinoa]
MKRALILSSSMKSKGDHPSYSHESSVHSDSRLSACDPGQPYSQYSSPSLGLQTDFGTGSWIGPPGHASLPNPANAIKGYTGVEHSVALQAMQPRSYNNVSREVHASVGLLFFYIFQFYLRWLGVPLVLGITSNMSSVLTIHTSF